MLRRRLPLDVRAVSVGLVVLLGGVLTAPTAAMADEDGVSFWLPGLFGSLAAAPSCSRACPSRRWSIYDSVRAGGDVALSREITIGHFTTNLHADINADLNSRIDLDLLVPTYVFEQPFWARQASAR